MSPSRSTSMLVGLLNNGLDAHTVISMPSGMAKRSVGTMVGLASSAKASGATAVASVATSPARRRRDEEEDCDMGWFPGRESADGRVTIRPPAPGEIPFLVRSHQMLRHLPTRSFPAVPDGAARPRHAGTVDC